MPRLLSLFLIALISATGVTVKAADAKDFRDKYEPVTLPLMIEYLVRSQLLPLDSKDKMLEYLAVTECDIYKEVKDSQFKQQEIQNAIKKKIAQPIPGDGTLYVKIPTIFYVTEYNFDTQSMTLDADSRMKKANTLDLLSTNVPVCGTLESSKLSIPTIFNIRLNIPISFFRIPLKKDLAETIYNKMDHESYGKKRNVVYGMMYIQIEPVPPVYDRYYMANRGLVRGQLNVIDLYLDPNYKVLLRQLDFDENY